MLTRLRQEDGMSLPELLTALVIASIVSLAAFGLIDTVMSRYGDTAARVDTAQRSRLAMDQITRELRSQVCVTRSDPTLMTTPRSLYAATPTSITFFADLGDESYKTGTTTMPVATLRTLTLTGAKLTETTVQGVNDTVNAGAVTFKYADVDKSPNTVTRELLNNVSPLTESGATVPLFTYWVYNTASPPALVQVLPGPGGLSQTQLQSVAKIGISFKVNANRATTPRGSTAMKNDVFIRTADPNSQHPLPTCM
jgi:prepilin-type N-terminal cleavage/methylation domain-containing protein